MKLTIKNSRKARNSRKTTAAPISYLNLGSKNRITKALLSIIQIMWVAYRFLPIFFIGVLQGFVMHPGSFYVDFTRTLNMSLQPRLLASSKGVWPKLHFAFRSAPFITKCLAIL